MSIDLKDAEKLFKEKILALQSDIAALEHQKVAADKERNKLTNEAAKIQKQIVSAKDQLDASLAEFKKLEEKKANIKKAIDVEKKQILDKINMDVRQVRERENSVSQREAAVKAKETTVNKLEGNVKKKLETVRSDVNKAIDFLLSGSAG